MSPQTLTAPLVREVPVLAPDDPVAEAVRRVLDAGLPALPVVDPRKGLAGVFGEREFMIALFPGYLGQLKYAGFVPRSLQDALIKRREAATEPISRYMTTDHVDVPPDYSDAQVAEVFLHHRVLIVPVVEERSVVGVITRTDFFRALAERFLDGAPG